MCWKIEQRVKYNMMWDRFLFSNFEYCICDCYNSDPWSLIRQYAYITISLWELIHISQQTNESIIPYVDATRTQTYWHSPPCCLALWWSKQITLCIFSFHHNTIIHKSKQEFLQNQIISERQCKTCEWNFPWAGILQEPHNHCDCCLLLLTNKWNCCAVPLCELEN